MRSIVIALVLLASTMAPAVSVEAADVQDVRLQIHRLTSPPGEQVAKVTGRVAPSTDVRLITVTVQVGGSVAVVSGKIGRSGRVQARGRKLDLAAAGAEFDEVTVAFSDASLDALAFVAADCVRKTRDRTLDCLNPTGPSGEPEPGDLVDGVYDAALDFGYGPTPNGLARLTSAGDGTRSLLIHWTDLDAAWFTLASDFTLSGYFVLGGDALVSASGSAQDSSTASVSRLEGNAASTGGFSMQLDFDLRRPVAGAPSALGGTWNLVLNGGGIQSLTGATMALTLTVGADGTATTTPTTIYLSDGTPQYVIRAGECSVAPGGVIHCLLGVDSPPGIYQFHLHGALDVADDSGGGRFTLGAPPSVQTQGSWTATR